MNKPLNVYLVITMLIGMAVECFAAFHVIAAIWRGISMMFEWLCNHINPAIGILTVLAMFFLFIAHDHINSLELAESESEEDE